MKKIKLLIIILFLLLITGCSDYRELSDMSIVSSLGLDKKDGEYIITSQILDSKMKSKGDTGSTAPEIVVYDSKGKTLHEALRNAMLEAPKKLYVGHIKTVIISEEAAKNDISDFFDFFLRDAEASKDFNILLVRDSSIKEIMDILTPLETIPAQNISSSIEIGSDLQGSIDNVTFDKFVSNVLQQGIDAVIPVIEIKEVKSENKKIDPEKRLVVSKEMGIFSNDKFLTYINENSSLGYNLIKNIIKSNVISFECNKNKYSSIELLKNKSELSFDVKSNTLIIKIELKGSLSELDCNIDITKEEEIKKLEKKTKKHIETIVNDTIDTAIKNYKSDFLGIGEYIFQNNYKYYQKNKKNIDNIIKEMKRKVEVKIEYIQKGTIKEGDEKY